MICPTCGNPTRITHTRENCGSVRRRRKCGRCPFVAWTSEQFENADMRDAAVARRELRKVQEAVADAFDAISGTKQA